MEIYTIGFTKKSAAEFFGILKRAGIRRLIDVRLNNRSQLAGFTKAGDLEYFLGEVCSAEYMHLPHMPRSRIRRMVMLDEAYERILERNARLSCFPGEIAQAT